MSIVAHILHRLLFQLPLYFPCKRPTSLCVSQDSLHVFYQFQPFLSYTQWISNSSYVRTPNAPALRGSSACKFPCLTFLIPSQPHSHHPGTVLFSGKLIIAPWPSRLTMTILLGSTSPHSSTWHHDDHRCCCCTRRHPL